MARPAQSPSSSDNSDDDTSSRPQLGTGQASESDSDDPEDEWEDESESASTTGLSSDEEKEQEPPSPKKKKKTPTQQFEQSVTQAFKSVAKRSANVDKLNSMLEKARRGSVPGATSETIAGLKKKVKSSQSGSSKGKPVREKPQQGSISSVSSKKSSKRKMIDSVEEPNVFKAVLVAILPYGVSKNKSRDLLQSKYKLPSGRETVSPNVLIELRRFGLVMRDEVNGITLPASSSHDELMDALIKLFPRPFKYLKKHGIQFYPCTKTHGRHLKYQVPTSELPSGDDLSLCSLTNRTGFKGRQVILTTSKAIPTDVLASWAKDIRRLSPPSTSHHETDSDSCDPDERPAKKRRSSGFTKRQGQAELQPVASSSRIDPDVEAKALAYRPSQSPDYPRTVASLFSSPPPREDRQDTSDGSDVEVTVGSSGPSPTITRDSLRSSKAMGKQRAIKIWSDEDGQDEEAVTPVTPTPSTPLNDSTSLEIDDSIENPWGSARSFKLYQKSTFF